MSTRIPSWLSRSATRAIRWSFISAAQASAFAYESDVDATLDLLADHLEKHIDCDRLLELAREPRLRE